MVSANKSSNAYQLPQQETYIPNQEEQKKQHQPNRKNKTIKKNTKIANIATVLACFVVAFCILLRYVSINEASNKVDNYKRELSHIQRKNEQMRVEIDRSIDLKKVESVAQTKLGMGRPEKYQMVYVKLDKSDYAEVVENQPKKPINNYIGTVSNIISNVLEYLN